MVDFYAEGTWEIVERIGSDLYKITKCDDSLTIQVVYKNSPKK